MENLLIFETRDLKMKYLICVVLIIFLGCSDQPKYISSEKYSSFDLDPHDFKNIAEKNIKSMKKSETIKKILKGDEKKVLVISNITDSTKEGVDADIFSKKMATEITKNNLFLVTNALSGDSSNIEGMIKEVRDLRKEEEFNQKNSSKKGDLILPDYSLSGKITQNIKSIGNRERSDYLFFLSLTDLRTGLLVWSNDEPISKVINKENLNQYSSSETTTTNDSSFGRTKDRYNWRWGYFVGIEMRGKALLAKKKVEISSEDVILNLGATYRHEDLLLGLGTGIGFDLIEHNEKSNSEKDTDEEEKNKTGYIVPFFLEMGYKNKNSFLLGAEYDIGQFSDMMGLYLRMDLSVITLKAGYIPFFKLKKTLGSTQKGTELQGGYVSIGVRI